MRTRRSMQRGLSIAGALLLSAILAGPSSAMSWAQPEAMTSSGEQGGGGVVALASSVVVAAYADVETRQVLVSRSTDSGATWDPAIELSSNGGEPSISGRGATVDVVWREDETDGQVIRYARSTNGGASFGTSILLSSAVDTGWFPTVARGADGEVVVAWFDNSDHSNRIIRARVSDDGGISFGPPRTLRSGLVSDAHPVVAVGKGVAYVAYSDDDILRVRRSTNAGTTWRPAQVLSQNNDFGSVSITAAGAQAYVAYMSFPNGARYRRTTDRGASWSSADNLSPRRGKPAFSPVISFRDGVLRATFARLVTREPREVAVFYRERSDGTGWTTAERVSLSETPRAWPLGVAFADKVVILFAAGTPDPEAYDIFAVAGTP